MTPPRELTAHERAEGMVQPVRMRVVHAGPPGAADDERGCGKGSTLSRETAESFARWPDFQPTIRCNWCCVDVPLTDMRWGDGSPVAVVRAVTS